MNRAERLAGIRKEVVEELKQGVSDIEERVSMRSFVGCIDFISELLRHPSPEVATSWAALADEIINEWEEGA